MKFSYQKVKLFTIKLAKEFHKELRDLKNDFIIFKLCKISEINIRNKPRQATNSGKENLVRCSIQFCECQK